jgi:serine O-acetyltransferase
MKKNENDLFFEKLVAKIDGVSEESCNYFNKHTVMVPSRKEVILLLKRMQSLMFPDYFKLSADEGRSRSDVLKDVFMSLKRQLTASYSFFDEDSLVDTEALAEEILSLLPKIKETLIKDVIAIYEGDPAARSPEEVILSYPGFFAISIYRIAHEFYNKKVPYMSRLMTEYAHEKTGIDIHAGATIGEYFFIDHGTGIVIGETTTIGDHVKLYQGVTLGAKSFELDEDGNPIKGIKRHPDIGDNTIIYAGATILGGNTRIGKNCIIGGNVWLIHSVSDGEKVYYTGK